MESGWDPDVKKFLLKVLNSISVVLLWMIVCATTGIYFQLGYMNDQPLTTTIIFYTTMTISFLFLIRYLYKTWKN